MKSLVRRVAIVGGVVAGSVVGLAMQALALSEAQILQKLGPVPVFTITDGNGAPLVTTVQNGQKKQAVTGIFISEKDAQDVVDRIKTKDPQLAKTIRVTPVSLGEVYKLQQQNQNKPNAPAFAYVPTQQEVNSAITLLQQSGQKVDQFNATPLFVARAGNKGYLTIKRNNQDEIPFFFSKEELQNVINRFKQQKPDLANTVQIQVVSLEGMLQTLKTRNDAGLSEVVIVPPQESIDYIRSLQSTSTTKTPTR